MEKALYPSKVMRISQGYNEGSHLDSFAIDEASSDTSKSPIYAPFTGVIKKIYVEDANEVWLESVDKVLYADGTIDYMTVLFAHADSIDGLFVGKKIMQKEAFYSEGVKGEATGNHCHIECGRGKFTENGWYKNKSGYWSINNGKKPEECFFLGSDVTVIDNYGYNFKREEIEVLEPEDTKEEVKEEAKEDKTPKLIFTSLKTDLYGIYLKEGEELYLK